MIPVLIGTTLVLYAAVYALPGDPVQALAGPNQLVPDAVRHAIEAKFHLDQPFLSQYWNYLVGLAHGDFGIDLHSTPVWEIIKASWPVTLKLAVTTWVIEAVLGVALGVLAALRAGKVTDFVVLAGTTASMGVPYFIVAFVVKLIFGIHLRWLPASGIENGWPASYLMPAFCLALMGLPSISRLTRVSILENLRADYVDTAVAKGLSRARIVLRHVLRNSLIPVVSMLGLTFGGLMGGTVLIEGIFNLPGLGDQVYQGIRQHNGPVVVGISTLLVLVFLLVNLLVDLLYGVLDPRIRLE
ncbi:MAG: ABC transporter permease [Actinomycetia bacterium]|nr:ABC transporter permease [Actinomycetes bacterium]